MRHTLDIDQVCNEYEVATGAVRELPAGDLKAKRAFALHKAKNLIMFADKLSREGQFGVLEAVEVARDAIKAVFEIVEQKDSVIIPPKYIETPVTIPPLDNFKAEVQLNLPFMNEKE